MAKCNGFGMVKNIKTARKSATNRPKKKDEGSTTKVGIVPKKCQS